MLIHEPSYNDVQLEELISGHKDFIRHIVTAGKYRASNALESPSRAKLVRVREGKTLTTDGPFAETKEQLGGFYLIDANDLDEATALAARIPSARYGCIEVRPVKVIKEIEKDLADIDEQLRHLRGY
jgi:hypothetical protein